MDGIWSCVVVNRHAGAVLMLRDSFVAGGNYAYFIEGSYEQQGRAIRALIRLRRMEHAGAYRTVWGDQPESFQVGFRGELRGAIVIRGSLSREGFPADLEAELVRRGELP